MVEFKKEHKLDDFFEEGIHEVVIKKAKLAVTDDEKEYIEFDIEDAQERKDKVRLWFTTDKAIGYSFKILRGIFVHNASGDKEKEAYRKKFDALENTKELEDACNKVLIGGHCWFTVYKDPTRTYTNDAGEEKPSYSRNIYGYEPQPRTTDTASPAEEKVATKETKANDDNIAKF